MYLLSTHLEIIACYKLKVIANFYSPILFERVMNTRHDVIQFHYLQLFWIMIEYHICLIIQKTIADRCAFYERMKGETKCSQCKKKNKDPIYISIPCLGKWLRLVFLFFMEQWCIWSQKIKHYTDYIFSFYIFDIFGFLYVVSIFSTNPFLIIMNYSY